MKMIYNTRAEFMAALQREAQRCSLPFEEMAEDFERHFSEGVKNGETESGICAKLGDPAEIVSEYAEENGQTAIHENAAATAVNKPMGMTRENGDTYGQTPIDNTSPNGGIIAGVILLDLLVLDWAIPTLASLVVACIAVAFSFIVSGTLNIVAAFMPLMADSLTTVLFGGLFNVFAGLAVLGLGGIMAVFVTNILKGFVGMIKSIGRLHVRAFTGRKAGF